jgi:hypothetical protein
MLKNAVFWGIIRHVKIPACALFSTGKYTHFCGVLPVKPKKPPNQRLGGLTG